MLFLGSLM